MAAQSQRPLPLGGDPTHYEILGISREILEAEAEPLQIIKRAYHRALLRNHPDKTNIDGGAKLVGIARLASPAYSIDQIGEAVKVLSDQNRRTEYDRSLRLQQTKQGVQREQNFQTGIENIDLDDFDFDEQAECWFRDCRCGNDRGYTFTENNLEEAVETKELLVGCQDCSLWLKVHFAVLMEEDKDM
jgi:curved DNA-binding protein CbpA